LSRGCGVSGMVTIALIPARSGSKRIPSKNTKDFFGHPLLAYTIRTAVESGVYDRVIVSTDSKEIGMIAERYGAEYFPRPEEFAQDDSPDIEWIKDALTLNFCRNGRIDNKPDTLCILRPTNPFRTKKMLVESMEQFKSNIGFDSMRAVERVSQHPHKMWCKNGNGILPIMIGAEEDFTKSTQSLPEYFVQNGSIEIMWTRTIEKYGNVCGGHIMPYFTEGYEGFDINEETDWILAEELVNRGLVKLREMK